MYTIVLFMFMFIYMYIRISGKNTKKSISGFRPPALIRASTGSPIRATRAWSMEPEVVERAETRELGSLLDERRKGWSASQVDGEFFFWTVSDGCMIREIVFFTIQMLDVLDVPERQDWVLLVGNTDMTKDIRLDHF